MFQINSVLKMISMLYYKFGVPSNLKMDELYTTDFHKL